MAKSLPSADDPRIRIITAKYRVIAPKARTNGCREFVNGSLVIEHLTKNALGEEQWATIEELERPTLNASPAAKAIFNLLANGAADEV